MGDALTIRAATADDAEAIAAIYAHYVRETAISFEVEPPTAEEIARRIAAIGARYPYLVIEEDGVLAGYAYATELYARAAYRWMAETSVYLAADRRGRGTGRTLYRALLHELTRRGFQAAFGKVTLPNEASARLHEALGFTLNGRLRQVGYKHGRWHDVGLYQLELAARPDMPAEPLWGSNDQP